MMQQLSVIIIVINIILQKGASKTKGDKSADGDKRPLEVCYFNIILHH